MVPRVPSRLGQEKPPSTAIFCTVYNLVRTADYLYRWTGDTKYQDYIERAIYNGFLAQQNRFTGMPAYFLPMRAGSKKKWGSKRNDFWCCSGTMVQAPTLFPGLIYYTDEEDESITVAQYIPSKAETELGGRKIKLSQATDMLSYNNQVLFDEHTGGERSRWSLKFEVENESDKPFTLKLRIPGWCVGTPSVIFKDKASAAFEIEGSHILIKDIAAGKLAFNIVFASKVVAEALPDRPELVALVDGPIVLAGLTDKDCGIEMKDGVESALYQRTEHTYTSYVWKQNSYITVNQPENFELKALCDVTDEAYTIYFTKKDI